MKLSSLILHQAFLFDLILPSNSGLRSSLHHYISNTCTLPHFSYWCSDQCGLACLGYSSLTIRVQDIVRAFIRSTIILFAKETFISVRYVILEVLVKNMANFKMCSQGSLVFLFDFPSIFLLCCQSTVTSQNKEDHSFIHSYVSLFTTITEFLKLNLAVWCVYLIARFI